MDRVTHLRIIDPVTAVYPGPRREDRTLGSHDISVDEQADTYRNYTLGIFRTVS